MHIIGVYPGYSIVQTFLAWRRLINHCNSQLPNIVESDVISFFYVHVCSSKVRSIPSTSEGRCCPLPGNFPQNFQLLIANLCQDTEAFCHDLWIWAEEKYQKSQISHAWKKQKREMWTIENKLREKKCGIFLGKMGKQCQIISALSHEVICVSG